MYFPPDGEFDRVSVNRRIVVITTAKSARLEDEVLGDWQNVSVGYTARRSRKIYRHFNKVSSNDS